MNELLEALRKIAASNYVQGEWIIHRVDFSKINK